MIVRQPKPFDGIANQDASGLHARYKMEKARPFVNLRRAMLYNSAQYDLAPIDSYFEMMQVNLTESDVEIVFGMPLNAGAAEYKTWDLTLNLALFDDNSQFVENQIVKLHFLVVQT